MQVVHFRNDELSSKDFCGKKLICVSHHCSDFVQRSEDINFLDPSSPLFVWHEILDSTELNGQRPVNLLQDDAKESDAVPKLNEIREKITFS